MIESAEFYFMVELCLVMWLFIVAPVGICIIFDTEQVSYRDAVKFSFGLSIAIILLSIFVFAAGVCISFLGGDPQPISTVIERLSH